MKPFFLRLLALTLALWMLVACFAACKDDDFVPKYPDKEEPEDTAGDPSGDPSGKDDKDDAPEGPLVRIMSYNILHPKWSNLGYDVPVSDRDDYVATIIKDYAPDVIGLQEVNSDWHNALKTLLVDTGLYSPACKNKSNGKPYNMTTFLYNPKTVELVDSFVTDLDKGSDIRVVSVAIFKELASGKQFVVTNTHPAPTGHAENYDRNFADLIEVAGTLYDTYGHLPLMMTGDFNTGEQLENYELLMNAAGVKDARYEAKSVVNNYCTYLQSGYGGTVLTTFTKSIDHIFVNEHTETKRFEVVIDYNVRYISDHLPICADIVLK